MSVLLVEGCAKLLIRNYFICNIFNEPLNDFLKFYFILGIYQYFDTITSFVECVLQTFLEFEESSKKNNVLTRKLGKHKVKKNITN